MSSSTCTSKVKYFFNYSQQAHAQVSLPVGTHKAERSATYVLDDHDQEGEFNGEGLLLLNGACHVVGGDIGAHDLDDGGLDVSIGQSLDVTVSHVFVPDLEGLGSKAGDRLDEGVSRRGGRDTYPME